MEKQACAYCGDTIPDQEVWHCGMCKATYHRHCFTAPEAGQGECTATLHCPGRTAQLKRGLPPQGQGIRIDEQEFGQNGLGQQNRRPIGSSWKTIFRWGMGLVLLYGLMTMANGVGLEDIYQNILKLIGDVPVIMTPVPAVAQPPAVNVATLDPTISPTTSNVLIIKTPQYTRSPTSPRPTNTRLLPTEPPGPIEPPIGYPLCSGQGNGIIAAGQKVYVCTKVDGLIIRDQPSTAAPEIFRIYPYTVYLKNFGEKSIYKVVSGPFCDGASTFWQIIVKKGTIVYRGDQYLNDRFVFNEDVTVWVRDDAEGDDPHWLCPWPPK